MPRGFFTQSVAVLLESAPSMDAVLATLNDFEIRGQRPARDDASWLGGFPEIVVGYKPERNGLVTVEIVDRPWPDAMGDPQSDPDLFGAWSMGAFGPATFPGNLTRATQQSVSWRHGAKRAVDRHRALLRFRSSWVLGAGEEAPILPEGESSLDELTFVTSVARAACALPETLAFFNPGGEVLLDPDRLEERFARAASQGLPPLDTFVHVRMVTIGDAPGWALMDTAGMDQLGLPDHEAVFEHDKHDPNEVAGWLMNLCLYLLEAGEVIAASHTVDGPGGVWRCHAITEETLMPAPRRALRWFPADAAPPDLFL